MITQQCSQKKKKKNKKAFSQRKVRRIFKEKAGTESSLKGHSHMAKNREQAPEETKAWKTSPQNQEFIRKFRE